MRRASHNALADYLNGKTVACAHRVSCINTAARLQYATSPARTLPAGWCDAASRLTTCISRRGVPRGARARPRRGTPRNARSFSSIEPEAVRVGGAACRSAGIGQNRPRTESVPSKQEKVRGRDALGCRPLLSRYVVGHLASRPEPGQCNFSRQVVASPMASDDERRCRCLRLRPEISC
jgi:hypothetical protein